MIFISSHLFRFTAANIQEEIRAKKYPGQTARICDR